MASPERPGGRFRARRGSHIRRERWSRPTSSRACSYLRDLEGAGASSRQVGLRNLVRLGLAGFHANDPVDTRRRRRPHSHSPPRPSPRRNGARPCRIVARRQVCSRQALGKSPRSTRGPATWCSTKTVASIRWPRSPAELSVPCVRPPSTATPLIDGGIRSPSNADLAAARQRVVLLTPVQTRQRGMGFTEGARRDFTRPGSSTSRPTPRHVLVGRTVPQDVEPQQQQASKSGVCTRPRGSPSQELPTVWTT